MTTALYCTPRRVANRPVRTCDLHPTILVPQACSFPQRGDGVTGATAIVRPIDRTDRHGNLTRPLRLAMVDNDPRSESRYNATMVSRTVIHDDLIRFEVRPDQAIEPPMAGQYVTLGLGAWEPRVAGCQTEDIDESRADKLIRRAYSISCPMLDPSADPRTAAPVPMEDLVPIEDTQTLEFYVVLVRQASEPGGDAPALTPRLFHLDVGDRLELGKKITGRYTLQNIAPEDTVWMVGTGTGEAPHNAMTASLLRDGHRGDIVNVTTVRSRRDLGYWDTHQTLMQRYPNYRYVALTTRDPINVDPDHPDFVGKKYIQEAYRSGWLQSQIGNDLSPQRTHVFLCGNPAMIGYRPPGSKKESGSKKELGSTKEPASSRASPDDSSVADGMLQVLSEAGFRNLEGDRDAEHGVGTIRFEKYW